MTGAEVDVAGESIDAFNHGERDKAAELMSETVVYSEYGSDLVFEGREKVLDQLFGMWRRAFPDQHGEIVDILPGEQRVGLELVWTGTHGGDMVTPMGTFPATGKSMRVNAFMLMTVRAGKIIKLEHFWDSATALKQLGLLPSELPVLVPA